jgi:hypothetical protein
VEREGEVGNGRGRLCNVCLVRIQSKPRACMFITVGPMNGPAGALDLEGPGITKSPDLVRPDRLRLPLAGKD